MGDIKHVVKDQVSTSTTPVVFGVKQSKAEELGWANTDGTTKLVSTKDIMDAVQAKKLSFAMTSATQSNSGASAYMAFLTALNGGKSALTKDDLNDASLRKSVKTVLSGVNRSSGSSDWLKDMVVNDPDTNDSMVNYESLVIQADKALTAKNKDRCWPSIRPTASRFPIRRLLTWIAGRTKRMRSSDSASRSRRRIPRNCSNRRVVEPVRTARWRMPKMRR